MQMIEAMEIGDRERLIQLCIDHIKPSKLAYLSSIHLLTAATGALQK